MLRQTPQDCAPITLTVRIPCQSPTSFLKSNTFTIVSAVQIKRVARFLLMTDRYRTKDKENPVSHQG